jgi:hypothetical protein
MGSGEAKAERNGRKAGTPVRRSGRFESKI